MLWETGRLCNQFARLLCWFQDHSLAAAAADGYREGRCEAEMAHSSGLLHGRLLSQPGPVHQAFAEVGIDGEIGDAEGREVLEEVAALRGSDAKVAEARLDDDARPGDLLPCDGNAEPREQVSGARVIVEAGFRDFRVT